LKQCIKRDIIDLKSIEFNTLGDLLAEILLSLTHHF